MEIEIKDKHIINKYNPSGFRLYFHEDSIIVSDGDKVEFSGIVESIAIGSNKYFFGIKTIICKDGYDHELVCHYVKTEIRVDADLAILFLSEKCNQELKFELVSADVVIIGNKPFIELGCKLLPVA